jgi:hypothetical protein
MLTELDLLAHFEDEKRKADAKVLEELIQAEVDRRVGTGENKQNDNCPFCGSGDPLFDIQIEALNQEQVVRAKCSICGAMGPAINAKAEANKELMVDRVLTAWRTRV